MAKKKPPELPQLTLTITFAVEKALEALLDSGFFGNEGTIESVAEELLREAVRKIVLGDLKWQIPRSRGL